MRGISKFFYDLLIKQHKVVKLSIVALTDTALIFLTFLMFFVMPAIVMTNFTKPFMFYLNQAYFANFFISLVGYQLTMFANRGFTEVQRSFVFQDLIKILNSVLIFSLILFVLNSYSSEGSMELIIIAVQTLSTGSVSFLAIVITRLSFNYLSEINSSSKIKKVLIYGTGAFARELYSSLAFTDKKLWLLYLKTMN